MKTLSKYFLLFMAVTTFIFSACHKDDHDDEEELITTVSLKFTSAAGAILTYAWRDLDGEGGNAPVIPNIVLTANTTYTVEMELLNESVNPADDITAEIQEESNDHLFIYNVNTTGLSIVITDKDGNNRDLGLKSTWTTGDQANGNINIVLKHNPDKTASNPAATGSTDIDVTFPVVIE